VTSKRPFGRSQSDPSTIGYSCSNGKGNYTSISSFLSVCILHYSSSICLEKVYIGYSNHLVAIWSTILMTSFSSMILIQSFSHDRQKTNTITQWLVFNVYLRLAPSTTIHSKNYLGFYHPVPKSFRSGDHSCEICSIYSNDFRTYIHKPFDHCPLWRDATFSGG
jgi:hypothetical protein